MAQPEQQINEIPVKDLVLWTENPRDPIRGTAKNADIVQRAIGIEGNPKWNLYKLRQEMGPHYDLSELPIVVYHGKNPVVYDGNRRVVLGKLKYGHVNLPMFVDVSKLRLEELNFPEIIPCNVCDKQTARQNVWRKHSKSGSWDPLERDIFLRDHLGEDPSVFLIFEEETKMISLNPHLNRRFVKDEILTEERLREMGFSISNGELVSHHSSQAKRDEILNEMSRIIEEGEITTRGKTRGMIVPMLARIPSINSEIKEAGVTAKKEPRHTRPQKGANQQATSSHSKAILAESKPLLGPEELKFTNKFMADLYSDLRLLDDKRRNTRIGFSEHFPLILSSGLRLMAEYAAKEEWEDRSVTGLLEDYVKLHFEQALEHAHQVADKDDRELIRTYFKCNSHEAFAHKLQQGAHAVESARDMRLILVVSWVVAAMLQITYPQA